MVWSRNFLIAMSIGATLLCKAQNTTNPSQNDKNFVRSALEGGNAEVALGKLAAQKGNSEDVKQFGQKMVQDHTQFSHEMRDVAQKEGIRPPDGTGTKDKALEAKLKTLSGHAFDSAYIGAMVKDHRQDLDAFNKEANKGNDTAIKDAASRGALLIGEHLKLAEQLARSHNLPPEE
jgi:putative membrane protein